MGTSPIDNNRARRARSTFGRMLRRHVVLATVLTAGAIGVGAPRASAIVDGTPTSAGANPWQVALVDGEGQFCGGTLISERIVVTAAHCVVGTPEAGVQIRAGVSNLGGPGGQTRQVAAVVEHAKYAETGTADIAMLVLDRPIDRSPDIAPIQPATAAETAAATTARVTGWGVTSEHADDSPGVLLSADVPIVDDAACRGQLQIDAADELCAGGTGADSCYGDSGGPLTIDSPRGRVLAGVVSWGEECGGAAPGVYAEVAAFADWIEARVADPDAPVPDRLPADAGQDFDEYEPEYDEWTWDDDWAWNDDWTWDDDWASDDDWALDDDWAWDDDWTWDDEYDEYDPTAVDWNWNDAT